MDPNTISEMHNMQARILQMEEELIKAQHQQVRIEVLESKVATGVSMEYFQTFRKPYLGEQA